MVKALIELDDETNRALNIIKAQNSLKDKSQAISFLVKHARIPDVSDDIVRLAGKRWYIQGFSACINYISLAPYSGLDDMHAMLGYGYTSNICAVKKDYLEYYYDEDDLQAAGDRFFKEFLADRKYIDQLERKDATLVNAYFDLIGRIDKTPLSRLDDPRILTLYQELAREYHAHIGVTHLLEAISYVLEQRLKNILAAKSGLGRHSKEFQRIFAKVFQPERPSFMGEEHAALDGIISILRNNPSLAKLVRDTAEPALLLNRLPSRIVNLLDAHARKFFYHQIDYFNGDSLKPEAYLGEIRKILLEGDAKRSPQKSADAMRRDSKKARDTIVRTYGLPDEARALMDLGVRCLHWQDNRKHQILIGIQHLNLLLGEIAKRHTIPLDELKRYLPEEITSERLRAFDHADAKDRMEHAIYTFERDPSLPSRIRLKIYTGDSYASAIALLKRQHKEETDLHGMPAALGKASGQVMICRTKDDLARFQDGMVLVTSMTRPEFVPVMRKAAAIITDEGGITCHAAIISRELGKPCVIGTKIATSILHNGDMVEVNANHGIIHIIDRA